MSSVATIERKTDKQLANEKSERILNGVADWCSFYRANPQRFVKDYLNVNLKLFQKNLIYQMMHNNHFMFWACRSLGKTYLTALFCIVRCILFPHTKICVTSSTRGQGNEVLSKIETEFMQKYGWGSDNLKREIKECRISINNARIMFHNGSWIKVVTASDNARGERANVLVIDEFVKVDKNVIDLVLKRFLGTPRQPAYLSLPEYKDNEKYLETNIEIYMSSAWLKSHWSFTKSQSYLKNMLGYRDGYFVCALPYQIAIKEGLKKKLEIEDEMSEATFNETTFSMEMECLPLGNTENAFFAYEDISSRRKLQTAVYPLNLNKTKYKVPDLLLNERRILSVDVALMASKKRNNDASSIIINSAIPTNNNNYISNIIYMENREDLTTSELALIVRRLFAWYKCTDLVIDTVGNGIGVFDILIQDIVDSETGELYPALSCCNNKEMEERCKVSFAPKVIWAIKANERFNSESCNLLRNGFKQGKINLLVSENEADSILSDKIPNYDKLSADEKLKYKMPYIQTTMLVYELIRLDFEIKGTIVKISEKSGMRKDRYSSLLYNYYVQSCLEREVLKVDAVKKDTMSDYVEQFKKLNRKPRFY